jgi:hypothetical protein
VGPGTGLDEIVEMKILDPTDTRAPAMGRYFYYATVPVIKFGMITSLT